MEWVGFHFILLTRFIYLADWYVGFFIGKKEAGYAEKNFCCGNHSIIC